jgi:hypothetical protein
MIDFDFTDSPLVMDHQPPSERDAGPHPGQRWPDWSHCGGPCHQVLFFGAVQDAEALALLRRGRSNELIGPELSGAPLEGRSTPAAAGH